LPVRRVRIAASLFGDDLRPTRTVTLR
jgi:hypothetical protein